MPLKTESLDIIALEENLNILGAAAKKASYTLALSSTEQKNAALAEIAISLRKNVKIIIEANAVDVENAYKKQLTNAFIDRLKLTESHIESIAKSLEIIINLPDPVGSVIKQWEQLNGLKFTQIRCPLGVIGVIFESRPNVTVDAAALCLKSGNAVVLRGGTESYHSSKALHSCCIEGLIAAKLPVACISFVETVDRAAVGYMLKGLNGAIDVIVPRGGKSLVERVQNEAKVPVFAHLEGICHIYVHEDAKLDMALNIIKNSKLRRTGVCGAVETLLIHKNFKHTVEIVNMLVENNCEIRGDIAISELNEAVKLATEEDWRTEYLDAIISIKMVESVEAAIAHIATYGSHHTESILTQNAAVAEKFLSEVDSAIVLHNASTQFADGGEFGFGAEIGIATGRFHARGPVGLEQLTCFKYQVRGNGQIRA